MNYRLEDKYFEQSYREPRKLRLCVTSLDNNRRQCLTHFNARKQWVVKADEKAISISYLSYIKVNVEISMTFSNLTKIPIKGVSNITASKISWKS